MGDILSHLFCLVSPGVDVDCWLSLTRLPYSSVSYTRSYSSAVKRSIGFTITEKAPTRAFSWLKAPTSLFTFKTLKTLSHCKYM